VRRLEAGEGEGASSPKRRAKVETKKLSRGAHGEPVRKKIEFGEGETQRP